MLPQIAFLCMVGLLSPHAQAGPLEEYLAKPPATVKWDWPDDPPQISVPKYQRMFRAAKTDQQKAIAIGNLSCIANQMALAADSRAAARQLNDQWVMPNLEVTRTYDNSYSIGWRHTVFRARNIYRLCGDDEKERECLAMVFRAKEREGDQDLAVYLLAYQQAGQGNYEGAIKTINHLNEESKWAANRAKLIHIWTKELEKQKNTQAR